MNLQFTSLVCNNCGSTSSFRPVAGVGGEHSSAFCYQCMVCCHHATFVHSDRQLSTRDVIINIVEAVRDLNEQIRKEPSGGICPKCGQGNYRSVDVSESNRMRLDIVECTNCHFSAPIISIPRDILYAYGHDMQLAKEVAGNFPEIALVFCVAALETYFRQLFMYESELHRYLVEERRINFQNLRDTRMVLKKQFGFDIMKLIEKDWDFLLNSFELRHRVIHCASFDKKGRKIRLPEKDIDRLFSVVDRLVVSIEMKLLSPDLPESAL